MFYDTRCPAGHQGSSTTFAGVGEVYWAQGAIDIDTHSTQNNYERDQHLARSNSPFLLLGKDSEHSPAARTLRLARLVVPLDPVELPRRPRVALCVLSPDRQMHRVPPSDVAADHTLVRDVLPHLPAQVRLDLNVPETIDGLLDRWLRRGLRQRRRHVVWCCERMCGDGRRVCRRREEGRERCYLRLVQVAHTTAVVDLHACAEAEGGFRPDAIEVRQGML